MSSENNAAEANATAPRGMSLKGKTLLGVILILIVMAVASYVASGMLLYQTLDSRARTGYSIADITGDVIDADRVDEFLEQGYDADGYTETEERIAEIRDKFEDIKYLYVYHL